MNRRLRSFASTMLEIAGAGVFAYGLWRLTPVLAYLFIGFIAMLAGFVWGST